MPLRITESGSMDKILEVTKDLDKTQLQVGIFAPEGSELFMIASVQEFGAEIKVTPKMRGYLGSQGLHLKKTTEVITIPERSFIRAGFEEAKPDLERYVERALPLVLKSRMSVTQFYQLLGELAVGKIHEFIQAFDSPANHPFTIAQKGSSRPLINTGRLNQSIVYKVVKG